MLNPVRVRVACVDYLYILISDIIYHVLECLVAVNVSHVVLHVTYGIISTLHEAEAWHFWGP